MNRGRAGIDFAAVARNCSRGGRGRLRPDESDPGSVPSTIGGEFEFHQTGHHVDDAGRKIVEACERIGILAVNPPVIAAGTTGESKPAGYNPYLSCKLRGAAYPAGVLLHPQLSRQGD